MSCLIIGGDSKLASTLENAFSSHSISFYKSTRYTNKIAENIIFLDIEKPSLEIIENLEFSEVFFCAGVTKMQECEEQPKISQAINVEGTRQILEKLIFLKKKINFISSSQVFGRVNYPPTFLTPRVPLNLYGRQKKEIEDFLIRHAPGYCIFRPSKILNHKGDDIFKQWKEDLQRGKEIHPASNIRLSPILDSELVNILLYVRKKNLTGIFHASATDSLTYSEAAYMLADIMNIDKKLISPQNVEIPEIYIQPYPNLNLMNDHLIPAHFFKDASSTLKLYFKKLCNDEYRN